MHCVAPLILESRIRRELTTPGTYRPLFGASDECAGNALQSGMRHNVDALQEGHRRGCSSIDMVTAQCHLDKANGVSRIIVCNELSKAIQVCTEI
jgi:hypothetical protein